MELLKVVVLVSALFHLTTALSNEDEQKARGQHRRQRSAPTGNAINISTLPYIEVLRGRDGRDGRDGVPGPRGPQGQRGEQGVAGPLGPRNGGVVYTRWGKASCPNISGTELMYAGRAGGSWFSHTGGGANYLCMPNNPDYLAYTPGVQGRSPVYGVEYELWGGGPFQAVFQHNAPCAVCYASTRVAVTMIPAKTQCPSTWTLEYSGYLMSAYRGYPSHIHYRTMFECVDKNPDSIPGSAASIDGAFFNHVEATCTGMPCPPYDPQKELTCSVCTK